MKKKDNKKENHEWIKVLMKWCKEETLGKEMARFTEIYHEGKNERGKKTKKRRGHGCDSALQEVQIKMGEGRENALKYITSGKWEHWQGTESLWVTLEQWHQRRELGKRMEIQIREVSKTDYEEHIHKYRVFTMDIFLPFFLPCIL